MLLAPQLLAGLFLLLFFLLAFVWPSVRLYRRSGINPLMFGSTETAHDYIGKCFKVLMAALPLVILVDDVSYFRLMPNWFFEHTARQPVGALLCVAALIWTSVAQWQMGRSWRIGIDEKHATALQTKGLFSLSRNPIFLGMLTALLGLFLLLPNVLSLICLVAGYLLIQVQIRLEEAFLQQQHGPAYTNYKARVPRLLGAKGKRNILQKRDL